MRPAPTRLERLLGPVSLHRRRLVPGQQPECLRLTSARHRPVLPVPASRRLRPERGPPPECRPSTSAPRRPARASPPASPSRQTHRFLRQPGRGLQRGCLLSTWESGILRLEPRVLIPVLRAPPPQVPVPPRARGSGFRQGIQRLLRHPAPGPWPESPLLSVLPSDSVFASCKPRREARSSVRCYLTSSDSVTSDANGQPSTRYINRFSQNPEKSDDAIPSGGNAGTAQTGSGQGVSVTDSALARTDLESMSAGIS